MDFQAFFSEIRLASPFLLLLALAVAVFLFVASHRRRNSVVSSYIGFFNPLILGRVKNPLFWIYRILPYFLLLILIVAVGGPVAEKLESVSRKATPYTIIFDFSGSVASADYEGNLTDSFEETVLNAFRSSLAKFVSDRKETSEFFLLPYSDTPYAARYFAGGSEAEIQIIGYLEGLEEEIAKRRSSARRFYLQGTHTAFAIETAVRYRGLLPEQYRQSSYIILTDFQDIQHYRIAAALNSLIEDGLEKRIYIMVISTRFNKTAMSSFQRRLDYPEQVRMFTIRDQAGLNAAFKAIGSFEDNASELTHEVLSLKPLRFVLLIGLIAGVLLFVSLEEMLFRKIP